MAKFGRDDETWERMTDVGRSFLLERARLRRVTSYTELNITLKNRTDLPGFDFTQADERAAMGHLLGRIVMKDFDETGLMLSVLVHYLDANDAGPGFYKLAAELGVLPRSSSSTAKERFWITHLNAVYDHYSPRER